MRPDYNHSFNSSIFLLYSNEDNISTCPTITLQVTDDCCLNCSYCYQKNKGHHMMSKEIMKSCIDLLFKMYDEDNPNTLINHHTKGVILDFIGGEPLMNIDTIEYGCTYFINQCVEKDHQWLTNFRFSMSSNGILYFDDKVQNFLDKFLPFLGLTITIDGPEHLHDACRKDYNGNGSFSRAIAAYRDLRDRYKIYPNTKITIAPENLSYLNEIVDFFTQEGCNAIHMNPIFEHVWTPDEAKIYYQQLKEIANKILQNKNIFINVFNEKFGMPMTSINNSNWCGGTGKMIAFDPEGLAYPCLRYMKSTLGSDQEPLIIGDINGIYNTEQTQNIYKNLCSITRRSQSTDECYNCMIANGCGWCSAWNYQQFGTINKRSTNNCWMHRAASLANSYYYNNYYKNKNDRTRIPIYLNREIATQIITNEEYDYLLLQAGCR